MIILANKHTWNIKIGSVSHALCYKYNVEIGVYSYTKFNNGMSWIFNICNTIQCQFCFQQTPDSCFWRGHKAALCGWSLLQPILTADNTWLITKSKIEITKCSFGSAHIIMSSAKWQPFCSWHNVLNIYLFASHWTGVKGENVMPTNKFVIGVIYDNVCYLMTYRLTGQETGVLGPLIVIEEENKHGQ